MALGNCGPSKAVPPAATWSVTEVGSAGTESQPLLKPATPLGGDPVSATFQLTTWSVLYHCPVAGPLKLTAGRPASGSSCQLRAHASWSRLAEPHPVARS